MVPSHNYCDSNRPKEITKAIGEYAHAHNQLPHSWMRSRRSKESREKGRLEERPPKQQEKSIEVYLHNNYK